MPTGFTLKLDWDHLRSGLLLLTKDLRELLPVEPDLIPVVLAFGGQALQVDLVNSLNVLYHPQMASFFRRCGTKKAVRVVHSRRDKFGITLFLEPVPADRGKQGKKATVLGQVVPATLPISFKEVIASRTRSAGTDTGKKERLTSHPAQQGAPVRPGTPGRRASAAGPKKDSSLTPPVSPGVQFLEDRLAGMEEEFTRIAVTAAQLPAPQIQLRDEVWEGLLPSILKGRYADPGEEYVHQRACSLSVSPGFDTLLALQAVRNFTPFPYQVEVAREVMQRMRGRAILGDEVGLGKTIEAGLVITEYILRGLARRVLVLCPTALAAQWAEELRSKFGLDFVLYDEPRFQGHSVPWKSFERIIASLDTAKREPHRSQILDTFYDCVVVDEAHRCRNRSTQNWKFVNELKKKYILLLTATPVQNDLEELYNLITLLRPGQLQTVSSFTRTYITRGDRRKPKNAEQLRQLVREVMIRNRRATVGIDLPKRSAETILVNQTQAEAALYSQVTEYVRQEYEGAGRKASQQLVLKTLQREAGSSPQAVLPTLEKLATETREAQRQQLLAHLVRLARETGDFAKGQALVRLLTALRGEKVIVFTSFSPTQEKLAVLCQQAGIQAVTYHGAMRRQEKEEAIAAFASSVPVLISSESGGEGRNLQFCHIMVNFDLPWNPMRIEQRIGRIHRIGQTRAVQIYNLAAAGTVEAHILNLLDAKINMFELVVGELDMILGEITEEKDFEDLIMDIWARSRSEEELAREMETLGDILARSRAKYEEIKQYDMEILG